MNIKYSKLVYFQILLILLAFFTACSQNTEDILRSKTWYVKDQPSGWNWEWIKFGWNNVLKIKTTDEREESKATWRLFDDNSIQFSFGFVVEAKIISIDDEKIVIKLQKFFSGKAGKMILVPYRNE